MKIVINALGPSKIKAGIGNYLTNLISELSIIDKSNNYIIFASSENKAYYETDNGYFQVIDIGFMGRNKFLRIMWEQLILPFKLKSLKADILFSPGFVCPFIKPIKYVTVIHDMTFFSHPQVHTFFKKIYFPFMIKQSLKKSEKIISVSYNTKKEILKYSNIQENKVIVTHLSANKFPQNRINDENELLAKKYNIETEYLLFVGMIEPRKNISLIIEALDKISDKQIKLVVVGEKGWMINNLFEMIKSRGIEDRIIFTGFIDDKELEIFYKNAKIFLYPSFYEGFGIPILEAMSAGCPVITSNISSLPEVAGNAAILINPQKPNELTDSINRVLDNSELRTDLITKGFENAKKFSWIKTAKQTLEVFENIKK